MLHALDLLIGFMPFAGNEHDIAWPREFDGPGDGLPAVRFHLNTGLGPQAPGLGWLVSDPGSRIPDPSQDLLDDRRGLLAARVIGGDDRDVAQLSGNPPHHRPLCAVRSEEHTSELQSQSNLVCRLLLEKKKKT